MRSVRSDQRADLLRIASAGVCALVALYWLGVASGSRFGWISANFAILAAALAIGSLVATVSASAVRTRLGAADGAFRAAALGLGVFALAHTALLYEWTRADYDRYVWVIRQAQPCSSMGGGPGSLWVGFTSLVFAVFAANYALRRRPSRAAVVAALAIGAALSVLTALAMFPEPSMYARVLGCV